jgi:hypothetical protein
VGWGELGDCRSDVTRRQRFDEKSISKVSAAAIDALRANQEGRNHGCIEKVAMITQSIVSVSSTGARIAGRVRRRPERPRRLACSLERLEALDEELARRASDAGRLRFEIGRGLDLLERTGGDHELGFSSIEAYALERCERSASWTQKARGLARRLEQLPTLADALIFGSLSWSMAAVLVTIAQPDDAHFWLAVAARRTVREIKALVLERRGVVAEGDPLEVEEEMRTLTLTVPREDAWCFEHAKLLGRHLGEGTIAEVMFGLVAESTSTLCGEVPGAAIELADDDAIDPQRAWERQLAKMRTEAEVQCESHFRRGAEPRPHVERMHWPEPPEAIDRQLRALAQELAKRDLVLAARSTYSSPPTVGGGLVMRPLRSTRANVSARASPRSRPSGGSPSASASSDFWPTRSNAASWGTKRRGSSQRSPPMQRSKPG